MAFETYTWAGVRRIAFLATVFFQLLTWVLVFAGDWGGAAGRMALFSNGNTDIGVVLLGFHSDTDGHGSFMVPFPDDNDHQQAYADNVCTGLGINNTGCGNHDLSGIHGWSNGVLYMMPLSLAMCFALLGYLVGDSGGSVRTVATNKGTGPRLTVVVLVFWFALMVAVIGYFFEFLSLVTEFSDTYNVDTEYGAAFYLLAVCNGLFPALWFVWYGSSLGYWCGKGTKEYEELPTLAVF